VVSLSRIRALYTDLSQLLKSNSGRRLGIGQTKLLLRVLRDVAAGLVHLHAHGVLHRDVKPANVLLKGGDDTHVKLCDFGLSKDLKQSVQHMSKTGAQAYMAPEMFKQHAAGTPADVWSFGVLLFECVIGEVCAPYTPIEELKQQLAEGTGGCGKELIELFEQCRHPDEPRSGLAWQPSMTSCRSW